MNQGVRTIIYPIKDVVRAKALFRKLLGVEPYVDQPYYVGFRVGDQEIGLVQESLATLQWNVPNDHKAGMIAFYHVDNIKQNLQSLLDAGAQIQQDIKDVGGGKLTAIVRDADGNIIGLIQSP
jgi:predicted enzyme related to lactoylglutathione lyase